MSSRIALPLVAILLLVPFLVGATPRPPRELTITITDMGFEPDHLELEAGQSVRLTFVRELADRCAETIVIPEFHVRRHLPLHSPVSVALKPARAGSFRFECGMGMLRGTLVVRKP